MKLNFLHMNTSKNGTLYFYIIFLTLLVIQTSCKKEVETTTTIIYDSIVDVEGNTYKTVKIGDQWWMAENLKTRKYRNGVEIRKTQDAVQWKNKVPAYCKYEDTETNTGYLYNFYTVIDSNQLAPTGWHIPTDEDWKKLEKHLGMSYVQTDSISWRGNNEANKLKSIGYTAWTKYKDVWPTNESGFTAVAGSCRLPDGRFGYPGLFYTGFWWTSTMDSDSAFYRHLDHKNENIFRYKASFNYGMSVRCVKD